MEKVYNKLLHEEYFKEVLDNGLTVLLCKRPSIKNATAMLTVKYGSLHQEFKYDGCDTVIKTPAGVAHFLEHKMFEMPNDVDRRVRCDNNLVERLRGAGRNRQRQRQGAVRFRVSCLASFGFFLRHHCRLESLFFLP